MFIPNSTYRLQLHAGFTFNQLEQIVDYLHTLGVSTIYASPITTALPGSMHGYDVTDPTTLNPEIGSKKELHSIANSLKGKGMSWLQDIVPNHMAFTPLNGWIKDILERGPHSPYYDHFDINWNSYGELKGRIMAPFLGTTLKEESKRGKSILHSQSRGFQSAIRATNIRFLFPRLNI